MDAMMKTKEGEGESDRFAELEDESSEIMGADERDNITMEDEIYGEINDLVAQFQYMEDE